MGSLEALWLMLAYAPVAPAPAPPPAVPPSADVVAPAPGPEEPEAAPAPAPAPEPVVAEEPAPEEPAAQPAPEPEPAAPETAEEISAPEPEAEPFDAVPEPQPRPTPHEITLVHRGSVSSTSYQPRYEERDDSFDEYFVSGYGGIITRGSAVSQKMGLIRGFHGGLLLGDRLSIGLAYHRLKRRFGAPILDPNDRPLGLEMAYGGLELGATVFRAGRFELALQTLFGGGAACLTYDVNGRSSVAECVEAVRMMVLEPSALAHVRVTDWMRVSFEGGYRGVARSQWRPPNDFDLGGGFFGLNLDFGWFARPEEG